jgi:hypothetical protein
MRPVLNEKGEAHFIFCLKEKCEEAKNGRCNCMNMDHGEFPANGMCYEPFWQKAEIFEGNFEGCEMEAAG